MIGFVSPTQISTSGWTWNCGANDDNRWVAVADFAQEPDVGTALNPRDAVRDALTALGEPYATEMAESIEVAQVSVGPRATQVARPTATISLTPMSVTHPERTRDSAP